MQEFLDKDFEQIKFDASAIVVGSFDGIHLGHRYLIKKLSVLAGQYGLNSVLFTFDPHPSYVLYPGKASELLTVRQEKEYLLSGMPLDKVVFYPFNKDFARMRAEDFLIYLKEKFGLRLLLVGYDHVFGSDRLEDKEKLKQLASRLGIALFFGEAVEWKGQRVSSSKIRSLLKEGKTGEANGMLGAPYLMVGKVVHGSQFGRKIGFPTANLSLPDPRKLVPLEGVYAVMVKTKGRDMKGVLNIGKKPTVSSDMRLHIEVHILDFEGDLYGEQIRVRFHSRLRDEQKFSSVETLKRQIEKDIKAALRILK